MAIERRKTNGSEVPHASNISPPPLPPAPPSLESETEAEVLARFGKTADQIPKVMLAAADTTRLASKKLIEESARGVEVARSILKMLEAEHEAYRQEVMQHAERQALGLTEYMAAVFGQFQTMSKHRETLIDVANKVANPAAMVTAAAPAKPALIERPRTQPDEEAQL